VLHGADPSSKSERGRACLGNRHRIQRIGATPPGPYFGGSFGEVGPCVIARSGDALWRRLSESVGWRDWSNDEDDTVRRMAIAAKHLPLVKIGW
jgi:hypothetical protein